MSQGWRLYGSLLSPFSVKVRLAVRAAGLPLRCLPQEGSRRENLAVQAMRLAIVRGALPLTQGPLDELEELPLVPFLFGPQGERLYDSSAIVAHLDERAAAGAFLPKAPLARVVARLLDEMFDEVGLYVLHHHRWVTSARDTRAAQVLREEFGALVPSPLLGAAVARFEARQVRRLPYLFSVAPPGFALPGLRAQRQPPGRPGFAPTHALLDELLTRLLEGLSQALQARPYLMGDAPCIADFSGGGMILSMLCVDPSSAALIEARAPRVAQWARRLDALRGVAGVPRFEVDAGALQKLCAVVSEAFVPLMVDNARAHAAAGGGGARRHNERAFDAGRSLFEGAMLGHPYRSVIKTFQVRVWRALSAQIAALDADARGALTRELVRLPEGTRVRPRPL